MNNAERLLQKNVNFIDMAKDIDDYAKKNQYDTYTGILSYMQEESIPLSKEAVSILKSLNPEIKYIGRLSKVCLGFLYISRGKDAQNWQPFPFESQFKWIREDEEFNIKQLLGEEGDELPL